MGLGSNYEQWLRENLKDVDIRTYDDDPTKYQDLRVGRTDAILVDRLAALDLVKKLTMHWRWLAPRLHAKNRVWRCAK